MKKKNLINKLKLTKTQVSNFSSNQIVGGSRYVCEPIDLSIAETCITDCDLTVTCTNFTNCNQYTFANCSANCGSNNCGSNNCGSNNCGTGGTGGNSGGISCPGYVC